MARSRYTHGDFCALCGVRLVKTDARWPLPVPMPWDRKVRAGECSVPPRLRVIVLTSAFQVCFATTQAQPLLTGVGYLSNRLVVADVDASVPYTDTAASLTTHRLGPDYNYVEPSARLVFGVHDACWTLLMSRITPIVPGQDATCKDTAAVASHLYNVLFCLSEDRQKALNPANDYGGAWTFLPPFSSRYNGDLAEEKWSFILADPEQASIGNAPPQAWPAEQALIRDASRSDDVFNRLPRELIATLLICLPSVDLCSLRLASRVVSCISSPTNLPMSFWRSRFAPGFEMAFYLGGHFPQSSSRDWPVLYGQIRHCLARPSDYPALCSRRRIWHILGNLSITLKALLQGSPAKQASISHAALLPLRPGTAAVVRRAPFENLACPSTKFDFAWDAEQAFVPNSTNISGHIKISTSFIHFDGRSFICGIRATASNPAVTLSQVGLIRPITEQYFYLEKGQKVTKVQVVCSAEGVIGARFFIQTTGPENVELGAWQSVGIVSRLQDGEGIAELQASRRILGLTLEFDASPLPCFAHMAIWFD
jgi:hypothetical protein